MIIYANENRGFQRDVLNNTLAVTLKKNVQQKLRQGTSDSMFASWLNSLNRMAFVLTTAHIPDDVGIAIEYNIPSTSKRVDFIITGYDDNNQANVVIIELKQWSTMKEIEGQDALVSTYVGGGERLVVHPSYQAWTYARLMYDYNEAIQDIPIALYPCAYLHNYPKQQTGDPLYAPQYAPYLHDAPAFSGGDTEDLQKFIRRWIQKGDQRQVLYRIEQGAIRPSKSLQDCISSMLKGNREFVMIDEQKVVYEEILRKIHQSKSDHLKRTVIVKGGPGTGKTVIAINLLAALTADGLFAQYASKNSAPRNVYLKKLQADKPPRSRGIVSNMFKSSGVYTTASGDVVDAILADEAHRLNAKSGMFQNQGENQIKEIIHAAKCSVFFIDESQRVTLKDIGSVGEIEKWAKEERSEISECTLTSQFRCNGSDGYLAWLDDVLAIRETANKDLENIDFDFQIMDTPQAVFDAIKEKNKVSNKARMVAGYCWNWKTEEKNDAAYPDIVIGSFAKSWNLGNTATWAVDPESVDQIGCIHTCQGLEFDYVGVIIGDDLRYEHGKIVTDASKRAHTDKSLNGLKKIEPKEKRDELAEQIIKNTYRTLMTRGMKGCYVYCTDKALADYLQERLTQETT